MLRNAFSFLARHDAPDARPSCMMGAFPQHSRVHVVTLVRLSEACCPLKGFGEGPSAPATVVTAARFRAALSVGVTGDRSHLCRSTWCRVCGA